MIRKIAAAALFAFAVSPAVALAGEKTVVLNVDNATCELCAPIVKKTLSRVSGVKAVQVKDASETSGAVATVTFDDTATSVASLIEATTKAGFPSRTAN